MRKVDTASMAVALEVRAPLLERGVVGRALRATLGEVYAGQGRKGLLRQVARQMVPAAAIDRKKMGFGVPMGRWVREDFAGLRTLLNERLSEADPWPGVGIDKAAAMKMLREHDDRTRDHGQRLYMLLVMSLWAGGLARG
jgi:asparagine synthase (glutamine-hydrolysing)